MATNQELERIARRVLPDLAPGDALARTNLFVARVMSAGNGEETTLVMEHFGKEAMRAVLSAPPPGIFDRESWSFWHVYFGLNPAQMPDGFFTIYPWFKDKTVEKRPVTSELLSNLPGYNREPVYSESEIRKN